MLLVQKYNSLAEIETEFKETVEALISPEIPFLSFLEKSEKDKPSEHVFYYYLFFGQTSNMPVGFAMIELVSVPEKEFTPFFERMMNKMKRKANAKWLRFAGPGRQKTFFFFEPKHLKAGLVELSSLIKEMKLRDDVVVIEEWANAQSLQLLPIHEKKSYQNSLTICATLKKSYPTYEEYYNSLTGTGSQMVKTAWKSLMKDKVLIVEDNLELSQIPAHHKLKNYGAQNIKGLVIHDDKGPVAALLFIEAKNGNLHVDLLTYKEHPELTKSMLVQSTLMRFFEKEDYLQLNFLEDPGLSIEELKGQGFSPMTLEHSLEARNEHTAGVLRIDDLRRYS
ncbi:MAG: hypothetical protein ACOYL6_18370 [Bacteriovoracaceae bacterium]